MPMPARRRRRGDGPEELPPSAGFFSTLREIRQVLRPLGRRRVFMVMLTLGGSGLVLIILLSGFSLWWTSQPSFCNGCHPMKPYVSAWAASPHRDVNCESCHLGPGTFNFIGGKIAGLQVVANYVRGKYEDYSFNAVVGNGSCLQCHEDIIDASLRGDSGIRVNHAGILSGGGKCIFCHSTVGHGDAVPPGSQTFPTMSRCVVCHDGRTAPTQCSTCHTKKTSVVPEPADLTSGGS